MTDKEIDRIIKANIKMAGFISLVKRMREAQRTEMMLTGDEDMEFIGNAINKARKFESEVDEYLEKTGTCD
jgi:hypothetical protein